MIPKKFASFLEKANIKTKPVAHKTVYTAFDLANTLKIKLNQIAKTVVVKVEPAVEENGVKHKHILAVLSAHQMLDLGKLKKILKVKKIDLDRENTMAKLFKIKPGAITPFAAFHKVPVVIDKSLLKVKEFLAGSGSFTDSIKVKVNDLVKAGGKIAGVFGKKRK